MATMHFHKILTCVSFRDIFLRIMWFTRSNLAYARNCHKGARKAKIDDIEYGSSFNKFSKQLTFGSPQFGP